MKKLTLILVLFFSTSVFAKELNLECVRMEFDFECDGEFCTKKGFKETDDIKYLKLFDTKPWIAYFPPEERNKKEFKDFYKNNKIKAAEFYEDNTFTKTKGVLNYTLLTRMYQLSHNLAAIKLGSMEEPLKKYYVMYAPMFEQGVAQEIIIINRYTLLAKFERDYRYHQGHQEKLEELNKLTDELIEKLYTGYSAIDEKEFEYPKFEPQPYDYQCKIIKAAEKLI